MVLRKIGKLPHYTASHPRQQCPLLHLVDKDHILLVAIATGYGLDGVRVPVGSRIFSSPQRPDRLWGPPNLL
jgi:hypothetical protein